MADSAELEARLAKASVSDMEHQFELLKKHDNQRETFTQTLLKNLREQQAKLHDYENELENERESRMNWQKKARAYEHEAAHLKDQTESGPFVVAIIDGDGAIFRDALVTADGESGGAEAAHALMQAMNKFVADKSNIPNRCAVVVKIYANFEGLSKALCYHGILQRPEHLSQFYRGFTSSQHMFDFVDVGPGKERADTKLRENFNFYLNNVQCKHILLGGICHDSGYRNIIAPYGRDPTITSRVSLLQTYASSHPEYKTSGYELVRFDNIFREVELQDSAKKIKAANNAIPPGFATSPKYDYANLTNALGSGATTYANVKSPTPPAIMNAPTPPPATQAPLTDTTNTAVSAARVPAKPEVERGRSLYTNKDGQRLDPPIIPPPTQSARYNVDARKMDGPLCNRYHLQHYCASGDYCQYQHAPRLSGAELSVLTAQARTTPCPRGNDCRDFDCPLGHVCPNRICKYGSECRFLPEMHRAKIRMVAELRHYENGDVVSVNKPID